MAATATARTGNAGRVNFELNEPKSVKLAYDEGREVRSPRSGDVDIAWGTDQGTMYLPPEVAEEIEKDGGRAGSIVTITKKRAGQWEIEVTQDHRAAVEGARKPASSEGVPAPVTGSTLERQRWAMRAAIDTWSEALEYAKAKGFQLAPNAGDVRALANCLLIEQGRDAR